MNAPDRRGTHEGVSRVDLVYNAKWRRTLVATVPLGALAFLLAWFLERWSGEATTFDLITYPVFGVCLIVLEVFLLLSRRSLRPLVITTVGAVGAYFISKLYWILFVLPPDVDPRGQMTENFFWVPVIYLLSFVLPDSRLGRQLSLAYTGVVLVISLAYCVKSAILGQNWTVVYALVQMNLANSVLFALTSSFILFKEEYTRSQTRLAVVEKYANTDHLTGLPNRLGLKLDLERRLAGGDGRFAVLFIDFDGFKVVNDSLGHAGGDKLLEQVASRLKSVTRGDDFIARFSGDEFVIVVDSLATTNSATSVANRAMAALAQPFDIQGNYITLSASIGISFYPNDSIDAETLIRYADSAMYRVKRSGKNGIQHYMGEPEEALERQRLLERDLRAAIEERSLTIDYQPLHDLSTGEILGFEALVRWKHPKWGQVEPTEFIEIAEQSGLIVALGSWVLNEACRRAAAWQRSGAEPLRVSVNVSPLQFTHPGFFDTVLAALQANLLPPECLELELTESIVMKEVESVSATLARLQRHGIRIAIDDFGTGYSSLAYLRDLPINTVKIDRTFINDLVSPIRGPRFAHALVEAIIRLAAHLELDVVAEGIEEKAQADLLKELGCGLAQGFHYSQPMEPRELEAFMQAREANSPGERGSRPPLGPS
ncbi:MAG TPA: bifunctional diguanylate cyclase/phosphodiesterase [Trueperaceae bacterium]